ncbi:ABC-2 type transport system permease protein [Alkalibaculum bacchi]|uniref:ABC-2 type transport system permease protein n=2 Tax=Alkalibaculum bacchi TaxID=645887 RepID=A0A366II70_9FIRM|nr:hypothetical protein [Alkalibaculum bacchi]RBP70155.1 ABC-2 type transport system permease protein [Alkalibaculum bacchi]
MKQIVKLVRISLLSSFGFSSIKYNFMKNKKDIWKPIILVLALASLIPSYFMYVKLIKNIYIQLFTLGQESSIFTLIIMPISLIIFVFGLSYVLSAFYFSNDMEKLIPLPIKEGNIVISKFISMVVFNYLIVVLMLLPVLIVGFGDFGGTLYIIYSLLTILLLPVIPLGIDTIIIMVLMKLTNIQGRKDLLRNLSMFFVLFIIIAFQAVLNNTLTSVEPGKEGEFLSALLQRSDGIMVWLGRAYPPAIWFSKSISNAHNISGLIYSVLNILLGVGMVYLIGQIGSKIYLKALLEKNNFRKSLKKVELGLLIKNRSPIIAIFLNDIKLVLRTPIYLFNCVSISFLLPILVIVMPLISGGEDADFSQLYFQFKDYFTLILIAFFAFIATANPTASTTYSREGKAYWINAVIPVTPGSMFVGRMLQPMLLEFISILIMLGSLKFVLPLDISEMFISLVIGMLVSLPICAIGVFIDRLNPKLDWDQPQKAVKQNVNVLLNMLIGAGYILLLGFMSIKMTEYEIDINLIYAFISILSTIAAGGIFGAFHKIK